MKPRRQRSILEEATFRAAATFVGILELSFSSDHVEDIHMDAGYVARHAPEGHVPSLLATWDEIFEHLEALRVRIGRMPGRPKAGGLVANEREDFQGRHYSPGEHPVERIAVVLADLLAALHARQGVAHIFDELPPVVGSRKPRES